MYNLMVFEVVELGFIYFYKFELMIFYKENF